MAVVLQTLLGLWPVTVVLAAPLMLASFRVRLLAFILGPLVAVLISQLSLGGPDSPLLILPLIGLCISIAALLAEALARISDAIRDRATK